MNKSEYRMGIGTSSILMIFVVLCLTTLGVLSFASARNNLTLSQKRQTQVESYYAASAEAERILSQIDTILIETRKDTGNFAQNVYARLTKDGRFWVTEDLCVTFYVEINNVQLLQVIVSVEEPISAKRYTLLEHSVIISADAEWVPTDYYNLPVEEREHMQEDESEPIILLLD